MCTCCKHTAHWNTLLEEAVEGSGGDVTPQQPSERARRRARRPRCSGGLRRPSGGRRRRRSARRGRRRWRRMERQRARTEVAGARGEGKRWRLTVPAEARPVLNGPATRRRVGHRMVVRPRAAALAAWARRVHSRAVAQSCRLARTTSKLTVPHAMQLCAAHRVLHRGITLAWPELQCSSCGGVGTGCCGGRRSFGAA